MKLSLKLGALLAGHGFPVELKDAVGAYVKQNDLKEDEVDVKRVSHSEEIKDVDAPKRTIIHRPSTRHMDRDNEIIVPSAWNLREFVKAGGPHLYGHNYSLPPVGSDREIKADDKGLIAHTEYADTGEGTLANVIWALRSQKHLRTASVGFARLESARKGEPKFIKLVDKLRKEWSEFNDKIADTIQTITTKALLIEDSDVSIPSNINAQTLAVMKGEKADADAWRALGFEAFAADIKAIMQGSEDQEQEPDKGEKKDTGPSVKLIGSEPIVVVLREGPDMTRKVSLEEIYEKALAESLGRV